MILLSQRIFDSIDHMQLEVPSLAFAMVIDTQWTSSPSYNRRLSYAFLAERPLNSPVSMSEVDPHTRQCVACRLLHNQ